MVALWMGSDKWGILREPQIWGEIWSSEVAFLPCSLCRLLPTLMVSPAHELENSYSAVEKHFSLPDFLGVFWLVFFWHIHHIYMFQIINISFYILISFQPLHSFSGRCIT